MLQTVKRASIFILLAMATWMVVQAEPAIYSGGGAPPDERILPYLEDLLFQSSRFNRPDDTRMVEPEWYVPIHEADVFVLENVRFELYYNAATVNFKVREKATGYVWSGAIDEPNAGTFSSFLGSGIGLEYINLKTNHSLRQNIGIIDTEHRIEKTITSDRVRLDIEVGGFCATRACSRLYDDFLAGQYSIEQMIERGLTEINVGFSVEVILTETGVTVHIPFDHIREHNPASIQLASLIVFPGMGATFMDAIPGYMIIPDGVGALIRYEDKQGKFLTPFEERFYGGNQGIVTQRMSVTSYPLSMPIFGAVHGIAQHAFVGIIESGDMNARLLVYPNGASNLPYNVMFVKYDFKQAYRQSFSSDGTGGGWRIHEASRDDVIVHYDFLTEGAADYVGIAHRYQDYLLQRGHLTPQTPVTTSIPIHLQVLMADSRSTFIGTSTVEMTTLDALEKMLAELMSAGLTTQTVSLLGWNQGGYSGHLPAPVRFDRSLGSTAAFSALITSIQDAGNRVLLVNNYRTATEASTDISYRNDVAEGVNRVKLELTCETCVYRNRFLLYPSSSAQRALDHYDDYAQLGVAVLFEALGSRLFSYHERTSQSRSDAYEHYQTIYETYGERGQYYYPNAYVYPYISDFFHAPLFNSQLTYFDDLVPIIPVVLRGHVDLYSQFLNFNSIGKMSLLMLIDFGMYPSYLLTEQRSSLLRGTDIEYYYATEYDMWRDQIIEEYQFINEALSAVYGARIIARDVLQAGLVRVSYDNGVEIFINYTSENQTIDGMMIETQSVVVKEVS